eukprot:TRINITY_DN4086_c0_g1_i6.p1 TRINITY_DN4086_c0_g1~~TRINITY_DN4086_c0_g1_i6.p1  ORF type:complete len:260 (-),score=56.31 TRINITY_DN4086_c0_g1_i6:91-870(-)
MNEEEIFEAAGNNDVKRLREFLDNGVDMNITDLEKGWTPLHAAASRGSKETMELLVSRGCDVNAQDNRGSTPLHSLVYKRFDVLAIWLIRQGANLHLVDQRGFSAYDNALDWFQKELQFAANAKDEDEVVAAKSQTTEANATQNKTPDETLKIYFKNGSYKSIRVSREDTVRDLIERVREKIGMTSHAFDKQLEVIEVIKGEERRLQEAQNLFAVKSKWPVIFSTVVGGSDTDRNCHFMVIPKKTAPAEVHTKYDSCTQ